MTTAQMIADFAARGGQVTREPARKARGVKTYARPLHPSSNAFRAERAAMNAPA